MVKRGSYEGTFHSTMAFKTARSIARTAFRLERRRLEPLFIARCSLGVAIALVSGFLTGHPLDAVAAAVGAMSTGFASLQGVYRTRAATMVGMAVAMAFSTVAGALTVGHPYLTVIALALWGFAYGLFASLGPAAAGICLNAAIALIVFSSFSMTPLQTAEAGVSVLAGGVLQAVLLVVLWPVQRYPEERRALAAAYRTLAAYARDLISDHAAFPASSVLQSVRKTLADPRPFGRRTALASFQALLNEAERLRSTLTRIAAQDDSSFEIIQPRVVAVLEEIANALDDARAPEAQQSTMLDPPENNRLQQSLFHQLGTALRYAGAPTRGIALHPPDGKAMRDVFPSVDDTLTRVRTNLSIHTPFGRHALRLAVVMAIAGTLAELFPHQRGYWIPLTAVLVLRPDFTSTLSRGFARIGGTLIGVVFSTALVLVVPDTQHVSLALAIVFATLGYAIFQVNYALYTLSITAYVVFLLSLTGTPEQSAIVNRLVATSAGGTLAMLSYLLWPTWEAPHTRQRLVQLLEIDSQYGQRLFDGLADPRLRDVVALNVLRNEVWNARSAADESLERMLAEPASTHELDASLALAIAAATRRIGLANIALGSFYADASTPALELHEFWRPIESGLRALMRDLSESRTSEEIVRKHLDKLDSAIDPLAEYFSRSQKP